MGKKRRNKYEPKPFEIANTSLNDNEHYTRFYDSLINSVAFKQLSNPARTVLMILKYQYKGDYTGDTIICPYTYIQQWIGNTKTIKNALEELEEKGFIRIIHGTRQSADKELYRTPNQYQFITDWRNYRNI